MKNTLKKLKKAALPVILCLAVVAGTLAFGLIGHDKKEAEIEENKATNGPIVTIVVPECIYLQPATSMSSFQYYINNNSDGSIINGYSNEGKVYFNCSSVNSVSISLTGGSAYDGSITINDTAQNYNLSSGTATITIKNNGNSKVSTPLPSGGTETLTWTFTYVYSNTTYTSYAYTTVYAPFLGSVAAAAETRYDKSYDSYSSSSMSVVWGIHSNVAAYNGNYCYYDSGNTKRSSTGNNDNYPASWSGGFNPYPLITKPTAQTWTGGGHYPNYSTEDGYSGMYSVYRISSNSDDFRAVSGIGTLYFDYSRSKKLNHIPNIGCFTNHDDGDKDNKKEDRYAFLMTKNTASTVSASSYTEYTLLSETDKTDDPKGFTYEGDSLKSVSIDNTIKSFIVMAHTKYKKADCDTWAYACVDLKSISKSELRELVQSAINSCRQQNNYTSSTWNTYINKLKDASFSLGKPNATQDECDNAKKDLVTAISNLTTYYYVSGNNGTLTGSSPKEVKIGSASTVSITPSSDGFSATRTGYTQNGWSTDSNDSTGSTSVTVGFKDTLYAIWKADPQTININSNGGRAQNNLIYLKGGVNSITKAINTTTLSFDASYEADGDLTLTNGTSSGEANERTHQTDNLCVYLVKDHTYNISFECTDDGTDFYVFKAGTSMNCRSGRLKNASESKNSDGYYTYSTTFTCGGTGTDATDRTWDEAEYYNENLTGIYNFRMSKAKNYSGDFTVRNFKIVEVTESTGIDNKIIGLTDSYRYIQQPTRTGYLFAGWESSTTTFNNHAITDGNSISMTNGTTWSAKKTSKTENSQAYTNYSWTISSAPTGDTWANLNFKTYNLSAGDSVTISGYFRVHSAKLGFKVYNGGKTNDYSKGVYEFINSSSVKEVWLPFTTTRKFTSSDDISAPIFQMYTSSAKGLSGTILDFDLKDLNVSITRENMKVPTSELTLTAKWVPIKYYVIYNGNGNTKGSIAKTAHIYNSPAPITANSFERIYTVTFNPNDNESDSVTKVDSTPSNLSSNYTFNGWNTNASGTGTNYANCYNGNMSQTEGATINLYAKWTPVSITLPAITRPGYKFNAWYNGNTKVSEIFTPTANTTLTANWTANKYDVYFDYQNGSNVNLLKEHTDFNGNQNGLTLTYDPKTDVYTLNGTQTASVNAFFNIPFTPELNTDYVVSAEVVGGTKTAGNGCCVFECANSNGGQVGETSTSTRTNLDFSSTDSRQFKFTDSAKCSSVTKMRFWVWQNTTPNVFNNFKFRLKLEKASSKTGFSHSAVKPTYDSAYGTLPEPTRPGYHFEGWYKTQS